MRRHTGLLNPHYIYTYSLCESESERESERDALARTRRVRGVLGFISSILLDVHPQMLMKTLLMCSAFRGRYGVNQTSLEQIFNQFAAQQTPEA